MTFFNKKSQNSVLGTIPVYRTSILELILAYITYTMVVRSVWLGKFIHLSYSEPLRKLAWRNEINFYVCDEYQYQWILTIVRLRHDDVIKWKHFPRYWPLVRGIHRSPVNSTHKGQWRGSLMFLWSAPWINGWVNNRKAGDLRRNRIHHDVIGMKSHIKHFQWSSSMFLLCSYI